MKLDNLLLISSSDVDDFLACLLKKNKPTSLGFLNQHGYNLICNDENIFNSFNDLDVIFRDGKGIELACKYFGLNPGANLNGTDYIPHIISFIKSNANCDIVFFAYGTSDPWLTVGASALFDTSGIHLLDGFLPDTDYLDNFNEHASPGKVNIVVLGMGMPKQEKIARLLKSNSSGNTIIICGGAIFDFLGGKFDRAPMLLQRLGFEWLYRLIKEPKRLSKRYLIGIPIFFFNVFKNKITF
ncbi:WecB/TagA/CpsF family glycosyltransferase [Neptuniibacter sp. SY11_33]|uniref:WecB/TagA/CpsF family glycosyltransferase n=1 Tax=Neptuniibacter sp. SY11_33 TaxID=3398215 RepID=UPI0039F62405